MAEINLRLTWGLPNRNFHCSEGWAPGFLPESGVKSLKQDEGLVWKVVMLSLDLDVYPLPSEAVEQTGSFV